MRLSPGTDEDQSSSSESGADSEPPEPGIGCELDEPMSSSYHYQTNNITLKNLIWPTTLVINSFPFPAATATVNQSAFLNSPSDIASTPAFTPVQPTGIKYPITVIYGKSRSSCYPG